MGNNKGLFGNFFSDEKLLWFIILFLLLFWCYGCYYKSGAREDEFGGGFEDIGMSVD
ncbi:MAG: hypothetical protein GYA02_04540 [Clostridiaceae bacterium]|jgi:hypothetical protein|nr:hypothetical protein [Clostridiaceae bacterium]